MLLVILGAGASFDSAPSRPPNHERYRLMENRPPLADELFGDREFFGVVMNKYPRCLPIIPHLRHISNGTSVEKELQKLQAQCSQYSDRSKQLAAVRYYMQHLLWELPCSWLKETQSISNYLVLVDHIKRSRKQGDKVCLVTFNYDTLLDQAMEALGYPLRDMNSYVNSELMLIKIHGSVSWGRIAKTAVEITGSREQIANQVIESYHRDFITDQFVQIGEAPPAARHTFPVFPAIAIPVESKLSFECPPNHIAALKSFLPNVTCILVIGWRATEKPFLELLRETVKMVKLVTIVNGEKHRSEEAADNLRRAHLKAAHYQAFGGGFTDFLQGDAGQAFFQT